MKGTETSMLACMMCISRILFQTVNIGQYMCCRAQAVGVVKCLHSRSDYFKSITYERGCNYCVTYRDVTGHWDLQEDHQYAMQCFPCSMCSGAQTCRTKFAPSMSSLLQHWRHQPVHSLHVLHCCAESVETAAVNLSMTSTMSNATTSVSGFSCLAWKPAGNCKPSS